MSDTAAREAAARALYEAEDDVPPGAWSAPWEELGRKEVRRTLANAAIDAYNSAIDEGEGIFPTVGVRLPAPSDEQLAAARKPFPKHVTQLERTTRLLLRVWISQPDGDPAITNAAADNLAEVLLRQLNPLITAEVESRIAAMQDTPF